MSSPGNCIGFTLYVATKLGKLPLSNSNDTKGSQLIRSELVIVSKTIYYADQICIRFFI